MIVIAGVRCGPGGPTTVSSKGGALQTPLNFSAKHLDGSEKQTQTEKLFSKRGSFWANKTLTNKLKIYYDIDKI